MTPRSGSRLSKKCSTRSPRIGSLPTSGRGNDSDNGRAEQALAKSVDEVGCKPQQASGLLAQLSITYTKHSSFNSDKILCK
jgi:hypothetical protein